MAHQARSTLEKVRELLSAGDAREAFQHLRRVLRYEVATAADGLAEDDGDWRQAVALLASIARDFGATALVEPLERIAHGGNAIADLYQVGYRLIEEGSPEVAATFLTRAHGLDPSQSEVLLELVAALESIGRYDRARRLLQEAPPAAVNSFMGVYLMAFQALMTGDLEVARRLFPRLVGSTADERFMAQRIDQALQRAAAAKRLCPLDERDLRGWHLVIHGGLLLHCSGYGRDEGMNGRYAFVQDSPALCRDAVERVVLCLDAAGLHFPQVFGLPDRASQVLASAMAARLAIPLRDWPADGSREPGLVVGYDLARAPADRVRTLTEHRPGQVLWSHAACWVEEFPISADLTSFLYQFNTPFWESQVRVDQAGRVERSEPDDSPPEALAARILSQPGPTTPSPDLSVLRDLAEAAAAFPDAAGGPFASAGPRPRQWIGGPVPSNRFD